MRHVYVHVPFCRRRCVYCDFAIAVRREIPAERYVAAIAGELDCRLADGDWGWGELETIYLGGGTPSLLTPRAVEDLLQAVRGGCGAVSLREVTLEANPDDVSGESARGWASAGVTRVSLGAQSFDDRVLGWMHRTHDAASIPRAVRRLRDAGIQSLSLDLIFGRPDALRSSFGGDVSRALEQEPDHLSIYGLTTEPRTPFGRWVARGMTGPATDERYEGEFLLAHDRLTTAGFEHYEVSNYARVAHRSAHNSSYWQGTPYGGLGPAAHSLLDGERRWNVSQWAAYDRALSQGQDPTEGRERLTRTQRELERFYLGLRTVEGVPLAGLELDPGSQRVLEAGELRGWLMRDRGCLRLTPRGWLRLDELASALTTLPESG